MEAVEERTVILRLGAVVVGSNGSTLVEKAVA